MFTRPHIFISQHNTIVNQPWAGELYINAILENKTGNYNKQ